jgi:hypothetical protein
MNTYIVISGRYEGILLGSRNDQPEGKKLSSNYSLAYILCLLVQFTLKKYNQYSPKLDLSLLHSCRPRTLLTVPSPAEHRLPAYSYEDLRRLKSGALVS